MRYGLDTQYLRVLQLVGQSYRMMVLQTGDTWFLGETSAKLLRKTVLTDQEYHQRFCLVPWRPSGGVGQAWGPSRIVRTPARLVLAYENKTVAPLTFKSYNDRSVGSWRTIMPSAEIPKLNKRITNHTFFCWRTYDDCGTVQILLLF